MSKQLRNLLKQNRNLEEKIFYEPRKTDWRENQINSKELSEALSCLAKRILANEQEELSLLRMINEIDKLDGRPLPPFEKNALQVVEIIFNYLRSHTPSDIKFYHALNSLQLAFTRLSLNDLSFLDNPKHIAVQFLNKLVNLSHHFSDDAGKLAKFFVRAVELLVDRLANREQVTNQTFAMADKMLSEYTESFNEKVSANTSTILAESDRKSREQQANFYTEKLIKSKTQGEEIPIFLLDFFENQLASQLHEVISQNGVNSKQCQQLLTDMDTLAWSVTCPFGDTGYEQRYNADVPPAMKRIYDSLQAAQPENDYVIAFFHEIEELHGKKLRGERVQYDVMISADIFADEEYENDEFNYWEEDSGKDFFDISSLQENHWYYLEKDEQKLRSQLLSINKLNKELLFCNISGELVCTIHFTDTNYLANSLHEINDTDNIEFKHATESLVRELQARLVILKREYQLFLEQRAKDKQEQQEQEEQARIAVQQQIEEEKRLQAIKRRKELEKQAEEQAEARRMEELDAKQRFVIKGIYRKLKPGATVAFKNDAGKWTEASLMLISRTTQRHIFTDSKGNKIAEPDKQEVYDLIEQKRIKVLKEASQVRDPLSSLVKERRHKLSQNQT